MKEEKALLRSVIRMMHPDLFSAFPTEQGINAAALKKLNHYLDEIAQDSCPEPISLQFWIKNENSLKEVKAKLERNGRLTPLYRALDLITEEEYVRWTSEDSDRTMDEELLDWLKSFVGKVVEDGEQHTMLRSRVTDLKADIEARHRLKNIHMGDEFGIRVKDLKLQLNLVRVLDDALEEIGIEHSQLFAGLSICLHQPESTPLNPFSTEDALTGMDGLDSWISDDGCLHLVVKQESIVSALKKVDLDRAGLLTRLHSFWERRATELRESMKELFQVDDILCDISTGANAQHFVLWAGCVMANRDDIRKRLSGKRLPLTLLVHSDDGAPMVDYSTAASTLHVRTDCTPMYLLNYVQSDRCLNAGDEAREMLSDDTEEQQILEEVRKALGAKHVIRICSVYERQQAMKAAERLIQNAESIRQSVDLSDAGIAIDSSYQAWDSGYVSIPYDYQITELRPNLKKLIGEGKERPQASALHQKKRPKSRTRAAECINATVSRKHFSRRYAVRTPLLRSPVRFPVRFV